MRFFDELMTVLILAVALWLAVLCCGCNKATLYPTVGAGLGAGAGSLAGPGGSIVGGMVGQAGGELFKNDEIKKSNFDEGELYENLVNANTCALVWSPHLSRNGV